MKKWIYLFLMLLAAACTRDPQHKGDDDNPGGGGNPGGQGSTLTIKDLSGYWVAVDNDGLVQTMIQFMSARKAGSDYIAISDMTGGEPCHFWEGNIYGANEGEGLPLMEASFTLSQGQIRIPTDSYGQPSEGFWKKRPEGFTQAEKYAWAEISVKDNVLTLAGKSYRKAGDFKSAPYAAISTTLQDNKMTVGSDAQVVSIPFVIEPDLPWLEVSAQRGGGEFIQSVSCEKNEVKVDVAAVSVAGSGSVVISCTGADPLSVTIERIIERCIVPETNSLTYTYEYVEGHLPFTVTNAYDAVYTPSVRFEGNPDWIGGGIYQREVQFYVNENNSGATRTARMILSYNPRINNPDLYPPVPEAVVTVTQTYAAPTLTLERRLVEAPCEGLSVSIPLTLQNPRQYGYLSANCEADWISDLNVGENGVSFQVGMSTESSSREAAVNVIYGSYYDDFTDVTAVITVRQEETHPMITVNPEWFTTDFRGKVNDGELYFHYDVVYNTSDELTLSVDENWLSPAPYFYSGSRVFFSVAENSTTQTRVGHIRLTCGKGYKDFTVTQTGAESDVLVYDYEKTCNYASQYLTVSYNLAGYFPDQGMRGESEVDWMQPYGIDGPLKFTFHVDENNTGAERRGAMLLCNGDQKTHIYVTQTYEPPVITLLEGDQYNEGYAASTCMVPYSVAWQRDGQATTCTASESWVHPTVLTHYISVQLDENKTNIVRKATLTINYMSVSKTFTITQGIRDWFDLGVSVQWAACSVGATSGEQMGNYYNYSQAMSSVTSGRVPTTEEWYTMQKAMTWTYEERAGVKGFVGKPKKEGLEGIEYFVPAAGRKQSNNLYYFGDYGYYWCSDTSYNSNWAAFFYPYDGPNQTIEGYGYASTNSFVASYQVPVRGYN